MVDTALNLRQMLREAISEPIAEIVNFRALRDLLVALIEQQLEIFVDEVSDSPDQKMRDEPALGAVTGCSELYVSPSRSRSNDSERSIRISPPVRGLFNKVIKKLSSIEEINSNDIKATPDGESDDAISEHESEQNVIKEMITNHVIDFTNSLRKKIKSNEIPSQQDEATAQSVESLQPIEAMQAAAIDESKMQLDLTSIHQEHIQTQRLLIEKPMIESVEGPKTETAPKPEMVANEQIQSGNRSVLSVKTEIETTLFIPNIMQASQSDATEGTELIDSPNKMSEDDEPKNVSTRPTVSENDSQSKNEAMKSSHSNGEVESEVDDVDSLMVESSQSQRTDIESPIISKRIIERINVEQLWNTPKHDEIDSINVKIDSIFAQIEDLVTDVSRNIKNLNLKVETLEEANKSNDETIDKKIANLNEKLENNRIKTQKRFDGLRAQMSFRRSEESNANSRLKVINRRKQERIHNNRFYGNCGCNALSNLYRCLCRGPDECYYNKHSTMKCSPVCLCCCSYIKGSNGNSNRINCNCCQSLSYKKSK